jgi:AcrR family transcriptional regulator
VPRARRKPQGSARPPEPDGRTLRSERSREAMVDALFELVGEGVLRPTAHQVAQRAGVGIRSVFRHFEDMDTLYAEMDARLRSEAEPILRSARAAGPVEQRGRALAAQRAALFERIAPYKRAGNLSRAGSRYLQATHQQLVRELRADLRRWLPELASAPHACADALELVTSYEAWDRLRVEQHLSAARARAALEAGVLALLRALR